MDTQLVRLDAPYNIICGTDGYFALHIASLIVVKEQKTGKPNGVPMRDTVSVATYPVVNETYEADGQVWMNSELKDCYVVCRQDADSVLLDDLKHVMEYCAKNKVRDFREKIPMNFVSMMNRYGIGFMDLCINKDYEVCLEFEEGNNGRTCMVYADGASRFYFYEYFANDPDLFGALQTNSEAMDSIIELRDDYLRLFPKEVVRSITFITENADYQWFVDKLNNHKTDGE
jgi:hypothetical protein